MAAVETPDALARFSSASRRWFTDTFERPTEAQNLGWDAISKGDHTLLLVLCGERYEDMHRADSAIEWPNFGRVDELERTRGGQSAQLRDGFGSRRACD